MAKALGITMVIEPVHPFIHANGYIHTLRHAARVTSRVENTGICLDAVHLYWDADLDDDIRTYADQICMVQLADFSKEAMAQRRWGRANLGEGVVPLKPIVRAIDAAGFQGPYESELLLKLPHDECIAAARSSRLWLENLWRETAS